MKVFVKAVNFILSRALNNRQFQDLLTEINAQYNELLHFCEVRWLSRGKVLERVFDLREEIATFLEEKKLGAQNFEIVNGFQNWHFSQTKHLKGQIN